MTAAEMAKARARFRNAFEVMCFQGSWGDTLDDQQMLKMLRYLNRTGDVQRGDLPGRLVLTDLGQSRMAE
jgi:hypothetical protein